MPALVAVLLALAGMNIYLFTQLRQLRADHGVELGKLHDELTALKVDSSEAVQRSRRSVETLQASSKHSAAPLIAPLAKPRSTPRSVWKRCRPRSPRNRLLNSRPSPM